MKVVYYYADPAGRDLGDYAWQQARRVCEMYDLDSMMFLSKAEVDQLVDLSEEGYTFIRQAVRENGQRKSRSIDPAQTKSMSCSPGIRYSFLCGKNF